MNLLHDPWLPVRDDSGARHWITSDRLAEPQWRAFDADRPDFNGALAQFAIGLLQTTTPAANAIEWRRWFNMPPDAATLRQWFEPVTDAFVLDGDGARFMQDFVLATEAGKQSPIAELLIETPGESGLDSNRDLFVKRGGIRALCAECAAAAVLTLQINAPEGGRGHFTGLRGGGPLTTLVLNAAKTTLWRDLWMNVAQRQPPAQGSAPISGKLQSIFPWVGPAEQLQPAGGTVTSAQVNGLHCYWAMPRRVRLNFANVMSPETCSVCGRNASAVVCNFRSRPNGLNYPSNSWLHPLTPYREKDGAWLPVRPKSDGLGYRHWLAWTLSRGESVDRRARVVDIAIAQRAGQLEHGARLWSFGYEMRKDNPICWHESSLPLYHLADCSSDQSQSVQAEVGRWLAAAELAAAYLRGAVKDAWFGGDARGDFGHVDASFWGSTEPAFYRQLQALIEATRSAVEQPALPVREAWHRVLVRAALRLFDEDFVGAGAVERQNPRRSALAHNRLRANLYGPKLRSALGLPVEASPSKPARRATGRTTKESA